LSDDPLLAAFSDAGRSVPLLYRGSYYVAERIIERARGSAEAEQATPLALAVRGSMHLQSAIVAARLGDSQTSDAHIGEAADLARRVPDVGPDADYYDTGFSAANVGFHAVAAALEVGDGTLAVSHGTALEVPDTVMRSRRGHHHIDMAGAWLLHGDRGQALAHLRRARQLTPEQTRYHPQVREIVGAIAQTDRRRTDSLTNLARWVGVTTA
ncbi:MAG TPA: XRE family transcriptional regulator, partial [Pseudonocardiaceae bacterium]|nr:XRE family transcriptional regulator [Pseudonocardiaceae bacterium]